MGALCEMNPFILRWTMPSSHRAHGWRLPLPQTGPAHHLSADISVELSLNPAPSFPQIVSAALPQIRFGRQRGQVCHTSGYPAVPGNMLFPVRTSRLPRPGKRERLFCSPLFFGKPLGHQQPSATAQPRAIISGIYSTSKVPIS